jgi:hypothetical protein
MLIYSTMYAVFSIIAWFMMAERRAPGYTGIKKRWLPRKIGPEFYSITLTVFIGIFGFLVTFVVAFNLRALIFFLAEPLLLHYDLCEGPDPLAQSKISLGRCSSRRDEHIRYVRSLLSSLWTRLITATTGGIGRVRDSAPYGHTNNLLQ